MSGRFPFDSQGHGGGNPVSCATICEGLGEWHILRSRRLFLVRSGICRSKPPSLTYISTVVFPPP